MGGGGGTNSCSPNCSHKPRSPTPQNDCKIDPKRPAHVQCPPQLLEEHRAQLRPVLRVHSQANITPGVQGGYPWPRWEKPRSACSWPSCVRCFSFRCSLGLCVCLLGLFSSVRVDLSIVARRNELHRTLDRTRQSRCTPRWPSIRPGVRPGQQDAFKPPPAFQGSGSSKSAKSDLSAAQLVIFHGQATCARAPAGCTLAVWKICCTVSPQKRAPEKCAGLRSPRAPREVEIEQVPQPVTQAGDPRFGWGLKRNQTEIWDRPFMETPMSACPKG